MKIGICLKLALFAFLCSLVCTIGFVLTEIEIIAVLVNWLWLATYVFLVAWLCTKVYKKVRYSVNLIFVIASFAIAVYLGFQLSLQDNWVSVNDFESMTFLPLMFVVFTITCLFSVMTLIGRMIFGKSQKEALENNTQVIADTSVWICNCGCSNNGNFCSECGSSKPAEIIADEESL